MLHDGSGNGVSEDAREDASVANNDSMQRPPSPPCQTVVWSATTNAVSSRQGLNDDPNREEEEIVRADSASEIIARLIRDNPATCSLLFGVSTHLFFSEAFRFLTEKARREALPYFSIPAVIMSGVGFGVGRSLVHPEGSGRVRMLTLNEGLVVFSFTLGEVIGIYCGSSLDVQNDCIVSGKTFWIKLFPAPIILSAAYLFWRFILPAKKFAWALHGRMQKVAVFIVESFFSILLYSLLYSRILQTILGSIPAITSPQPVIYEGGGISGALGMLMLQTLIPQHRQKWNTIIYYTMAANLVIYLVKFLMQESDLQGWSAILKLVVFSLLFLAGVVSTVGRFKKLVAAWHEQALVPVQSGPSLLCRQEVYAGLLLDLKDTNARLDLVKWAREDPQIARCMNEPVVAEVCRHDPEVQRYLLRRHVTAQPVQEDVESSVPPRTIADASRGRGLFFGFGSEGPGRRAVDAADTSPLLPPSRQGYPD
jgi:hypothetical protein